MKTDSVLVVGASGTVGSELARILSSEGYRVIKTSSQKIPAGTKDVRHLNLVSGQGLHEAFEGIDRAFFLSPPGIADQYSTLSPLIQEAKRRGLKKVVLMTAMGANASDQTPFRRAELELERSGLSYNIIRPNWFMQNFNTFWVSGIRGQGKILLPAGKAKSSFIDSRDISAVAAKLLSTDSFSNRDFDLTGPVALDHDEVAKLIARAAGKNVLYEEISPDSFKQRLLAAQLPPDYVEFMGLIMGFLREGYASAVNDSVEKILGRKAASFETYARDFAKEF